MKKEYSFW